MNGDILRDFNIVCFGSEKWEYPGFQQSVMKALSERNRILFINAVGMRKVSLTANMAKIGLAWFKRLRSGKKGVTSITNNIVVFNPFIIPLIYNRYVQIVNRWILKKRIPKLLKQMGFDTYLLWVGTPIAFPFVDLFDPKLLIYNPVDRYSTFSFVNKKKIREYEKAIASAADIIIATSYAIREDMSVYNGNCHVVNHGVQFDHFSQAKVAMETPEDLRSIRKPIIGYVGALSEWLNLSLIKEVALRYSDASVVLIGKADIDLSTIRDISNMHYIGFRSFQLLPTYLGCFDVCIIPFHINELVKGVDPIKLTEYLCTGKPIVTTDLPEARKFQQFIYIARTEDEFIRKIGEALQECNMAMLEKRASEAKKHDWPNKIVEVSRHILGQLAEEKSKLNTYKH